jgi:hypothetical protein
VGKSDVVRQVAEATGRELVDVRAVQMDPVDWRGVPTVRDGMTHWAPPSFLPRDPDSSGILFLDELNAAPPLVQASCYQLILDRRLGDYALPPGWVVFAAGNRAEDRAVTSRMPTALANRLVHLDAHADLEDWAAWALAHGVAAEVIAFLRFRPALLHDFQPGRDTRAFPTPRAWASVSRLFAAKPPEAVELPLYAGTVGEAAAAEFLGFLRIWRKLPNPVAVLLDPAAADVPRDPATLYALTGALVARVSDANAARFMAYALRLPAEFGVMMVRDGVNRCPALTTCREFQQWATKNAAVLI